MRGIRKHFTQTYLKSTARFLLCSSRGPNQRLPSISLTRLRSPFRRKPCPHLLSSSWRALCIRLPFSFCRGVSPRLFLRFRKGPRSRLPCSPRRGLIPPIFFHFKIGTILRLSPAPGGIQARASHPVLHSLPRLVCHS